MFTAVAEAHSPCVPVQWQGGDLANVSREFRGGDGVVDEGRQALTEVGMMMITPGANRR